MPSFFFIIELYEWKSLEYDSVTMSNIVKIPANLLPDPAKLELLADMFDRTKEIPSEDLEALLKKPADADDTEICDDLRNWARNLREFGVNGQFQRKS